MTGRQGDATRIGDGQLALWQSRLVRHSVPFNLSEIQDQLTGVSIMANYFEKKAREELERRMRTTGGALAVAGRRLWDPMRVVVEKMGAIFDDENAPEPTETELAELRHRYIEDEALHQEMHSLENQRYPNWPSPFLGNVLLLLYRAVVLAAAVLVIYNLGVT